MWVYITAELPEGCTWLKQKGLITGLHLQITNATRLGEEPAEALTYTNGSQHGCG